MDLSTAEEFHNNQELLNEEVLEDWSSYLSNPVLTLGVGMLCGVVVNLLSRGGGANREAIRSVSMENLAAAASILTGPYKMVLLVRTDIGMHKGKAAAQCAHAALACYKKGIKTKPENVKAWEATGQTKICLKVENEEAMLNLAGVAKVHGLTWSIIRDAGRTQVEAGTMTVLGLGPDKVDTIDKITGHLKLY